MKERGITKTVLLTGATTLGKIAFYGIVCAGSAAAGQINILDATATVATIPVAITGSNNLILSAGVAFTNFNTVMSASANYTIFYRLAP